ncbi:MAG: hypothetical protein NXI04_04850 [Planctomycetaceae bacterium]|nr:hypothetical protein [Planctomycetaceae bacterium]
MTGLLRTGLLLTFALFWGGLTFYTGIVVRISHDVVSDLMEGGLITQRVTIWLQILGAACVLLMMANAAVVFRSRRRWGTPLWICALLTGSAIVGLTIVHGHLDAVIDVAEQTVTDQDAFDIGHRRYNQLTTVEWLASLSYLIITVFAWQRIDSTTEPSAAAHQ